LFAEKHIKEWQNPKESKCLQKGATVLKVQKAVTVFEFKKRTII